MLFFEEKRIDYEPASFVNVVNELKKENLPKSRGLIVQMLKEKQSVKKLAKVIVKNS